MSNAAKVPKSRWSPRDWRPRTRFVAVLLLAACLLGLIWLLAYHLPESLPSKIDQGQDRTGRFQAEEIARRRTAGLAILAGVLAALSAVVAGLNHKIARDEHRLANRNHDLARRGQITERYGRAIEHLNNDNLGIRLGGIYALEGITREEPQEHQAVYSVLAAFIGTHQGGERPSVAPPERSSGVVNVPIPLPDDVRTALSVIARRPDHTASRDLARSLFGVGGRARFSLSRVQLENARLQCAGLAGAHIELATLTHADLRWANLTDAFLTETDLRGANLAGAFLNGAYLVMTVLTKANLAGAHLMKATLDDAFLSEAILTRALMVEAKLVGAELERADLSGAILTHANLTRANLTGAHLTDADLIGANLTDADLTGADLTRADLNEAILTGAILTGANLTGAYISHFNRALAKKSGAATL